MELIERWVIDNLKMIKVPSKKIDARSMKEKNLMKKPNVVVLTNCYRHHKQEQE